RAELSVGADGFDESSPGTPGIHCDLVFPCDGLQTQIFHLVGLHQRHQLTVGLCVPCKWHCHEQADNEDYVLHSLCKPFVRRKTLIEFCSLSSAHSCGSKMLFLYPD